ncbi:MAG: site-specific integrase [Erysipelotrichaceae bacterium]|nr:site-specific integrase [Erysipelotrichaceae bacterium]
MPVYKNDKKTKDGRQYYFVVSYQDLSVKRKKHFSKNYMTKKEAQKAEAAYMLNMGKELNHKMTFDEAIEQFLLMKEDSVKPQTLPTIKILCNHISSLIGSKRIEDLKMSEYELFKKKIHEMGFSTGYENKIHRTVVEILKYQRKRNGIYNDIPEICGGFKEQDHKVKSMDFYTYEEFMQFISVVDDIIWKSLFTTLYFCGLRLGEANALMWEDIDFEKNTLSVSKTVNTKMRDKHGNYLVTSPKTKSSIRTLPLSKKVSDILKELYNYYSSFEGFNSSWNVFGGIKALPDTTIQKKKNTYAKEAGIKQIRVHDFRHSCASLLINMNANVTVVAKYLGHTDVAMTLNTYSHFYKSKLEELVYLIDEL